MTVAPINSWIHKCQIDNTIAHKRKVSAAKELIGIVKKRHLYMY